MKTRVIGGVLIAVLAVAGVWQSRRLYQSRTAATAPAATGAGWIDRLFSQNPREVEAATAEVTRLGPAAVPVIQATLRDPQAEAERLKAALKAAGILGKIAAPAVAEVAAVLEEPGLTAEAAIALSYMGAEAFPALKRGASSADAMVRRESLRSIGKMKERAPLALDQVLPLLIERMKDPDEGVRAVAATYLGIIHEGADQAVPVLIEGLRDPDAEVRRASAAALGSFGSAAMVALPALRAAGGDRNEDVAREAGRTIVKLQQK